MGGRRVAQPGKTLLLRRVLPHQQHQQNHHQSRPLVNVANDAPSRQLDNLREMEEDDDVEEEDAEGEEVYSQDSHASSAGSVVSARTAAGDETAEVTGPIGDLERLHAIQRALNSIIQTSALTTATSYL